MRFSWSDGRRLTGVTKGENSISYTYNSGGLRTSKTVNGAVTEYYWLNGNLQGQKTGSEYIIYLHDENGNAYGFLLKNGASEEYYYYIFNAQGDVIGILDSTGAQVVEYSYNKWGGLLSVTGSLSATVGQKNPLRYRGYYYDNETGFYYLQSRYYDPETGRFINADSQLNAKDGILGYNLFAYCNNNPIMYSDPSGHSLILACIIVGAVVGGLAGGHIAAKVSKAKTGKVNGLAVAGGIVGGGVLGGLAGWGIGAAITAIGTAVTGGAATAVAPIVQQAVEKASQASNSTTLSNAVNSGKNIYYQVTSTQAIEQMKQTLQLRPIESAYNYVMQYQPTFEQAKNLGCRSLETVVRFSTNFSSFVPDTSCSVPGALISNIPGVIDIMEDIVEVGFK